MIACGKLSRLTITSMCIIALGLVNGCANYKSSDAEPSDATNASSNAKVQDNSSMQSSAEETLAEVYDVTVKEDLIRFLTKSNGCTTAQNFSLNITHLLKEDSDTAIVSINLVKPDYCKGLTRIVAIEMPMDIAKVDSVMVTNPKQSAPKINKPKR